MFAHFNIVFTSDSIVLDLQENRFSNCCEKQSTWKQNLFKLLQAFNRLGFVVVLVYTQQQIDS